MDRDPSRVNWEEFVRCQVRANETCSEAKRQSSDTTMDVLSMSSPLVSGGPLLSLQCLARFRHCLRLLLRLMDWCVGW